MYSSIILGFFLLKIIHIFSILAYNRSWILSCLCLNIMTVWNLFIYYLYNPFFFFNHTVTGTSVIMLSWQQMHLESCQSLEKLKYLLCQMVLPLRTSNHYRVFIESTVRYFLWNHLFLKVHEFSWRPVQENRAKYIAAMTVACEFPQDVLLISLKRTAKRVFWRIPFTGKE